MTSKTIPQQLTHGKTRQTSLYMYGQSKESVELEFVALKRTVRDRYVFDPQWPIRVSE